LGILVLLLLVVGAVFAIKASNKEKPRQPPKGLILIVPKRENSGCLLVVAVGLILTLAGSVLAMTILR
jgi:hypothetical protein